MHTRTIFPLAVALLAAAPASGQFGTVSYHRKVSELTGVFAGGLDSNDQLGRAVIAAGDINGDGNVDLVSGAIGDDDGGIMGIDSDTGALWVHFLSANGSVLANTKISQTTGGLVADLDTRDQFGRALGAIGDFDKDGVPDIAAGACHDDDGGNNHGAIYLLYLKRDGTVKGQSKISDTAGNFQGVLEDFDEFGRAIANLGDLDGNGVIDIAVGSIGDDDGGVDSKGAFYVLFMNADGTVLRDQKISDTAGNFQGILGGGDYFGFALANLGDVDGDGVTDVAVGAPKDDDGGVRKGAVWILFLKSDGTVKGFKKISDVGGVYGLQPGNEFGSAVSGLGDLDGDGIPDMASGAILDDGALNDNGAVWINFLNADGSVKSKVKINDVSGNFHGVLANGDWFGSALAAMDDLDGDGKRELAVGARFDDDGGVNTGSVWILFMNAVANVRPTPAFAPSAASGVAPLGVTFHNRSSAGADVYQWDFGDGTGSNLFQPNHMYAQPGVYTVSLEVSGPGGTAELVVPNAVAALHGASATLRNGSGVNRMCYQATSLPRLGTTLTYDVDATAHPSAKLTVVIGTSAPMSGIIQPAGELLIKLPSQGARFFYSTAAQSGGGIAHHAIALPSLPILAGLQAYTQAFVLGGQLEFCNALDLVLGY